MTTSGVDFTNVLRAAFARENILLKVAKETDNLTVFLRFCA